MKLEVFKTYQQIADEPEMEILKELSYFFEFISKADVEYVPDHQNWGLVGEVVDEEAEEAVQGLHDQIEAIEASVAATRAKRNAATAFF